MKQLPSPYLYIKKQCVKSGLNHCDIFTFKNLYNDVVILEVFKYNDNVYVIKFFLKKHKLSKEKYSFQYSTSFLKEKGFVSGVKNFFKTLDTILTIGMEYSKKDNLASFGFMGAPKPEELLNRDELDITIANTTRYSIYKSYSLRYFNPKHFTFIDSNTSSIFFIRNERNRKNLPKAKVMRIIKDEIIPNL